jgi:hypothetical protein
MALKLNRWLHFSFRIDNFNANSIVEGTTWKASFFHFMVSRYKIIPCDKRGRVSGMVKQHIIRKKNLSIYSKIKLWHIEKGI